MIKNLIKHNLYIHVYIIPCFRQECKRFLDKSAKRRQRGRFGLAGARAGSNVFWDGGAGDVCDERQDGNKAYGRGIMRAEKTVQRHGRGEMGQWRMGEQGRQCEESMRGSVAERR